MATQDRLPTGDSAVAGNNNWTALGGGSKYVEVDDPIGSPDDDSTYTFVQANTQQLHTFPVFDIASTAITKLTIAFRGQRTAAGNVNVAARIRVQSNITNGGNHAQTTSWANYATDFLTNPNTGSAWTEDQIEGVGTNELNQFGYTSSGWNTGEEARVTQCYATVQYTAPAAGNPWYYYQQQ